MLNPLWPSIPHLGPSAQSFVTKSDFGGTLWQKSTPSSKKMPWIVLWIKRALNTHFEHGDRSSRTLFFHNYVPRDIQWQFADSADFFLYVFCLQHLHRTWCSHQPDTTQVPSAPLSGIAAQAVGYSGCWGASVLAGEEHAGGCRMASSSQTQPASLEVPTVSCCTASVGAHCSTQCLLQLFVLSKGQDSSLSVSLVLGCWFFCDFNNDV